MAKNNKTTAAERAFNTLYNKKEEDSVSTVAQRAFNSLYNSEYLAQKSDNPYQAAVAQYNNAPITTQKQNNSAVAQFAPVKNRLEAAITNNQKNISPQEYKQYIANNNVTPTQKKAEIREQSKVNNFENAIKTGKITEQDLKNAFGNIDDVRNDIKNEQINTYENIKKTDPRAASAYINQPRNIISEADQRRALTLQKLEALGVDSKLAESYYLNQDLAKKDYGLMSDSEKEQLKNEYESLGQSNVVQRYFADNSIQNKKNYNRQQELYENYRKLKEDEAYNKLLNTGMKPEELDAIGSYTTYESDIKELEKQGYSEEEIEKYAQDKIDRYEAAQKKLYNIVSNLKDNDLSFEDYMNLVKDRYDDPALRRDAEEHAVGNSLFTLATNPVDSTFSALANAGNFITGRPMRDYNTYTDITRDTVTENIDNRFGQIAYGGAMSIGDMAVAAGLAYATGGGSIVSAGVQALEKAAQVMDEGIGRNLTPEQIIAEGIGSGVTTFITEKIPMGKLSKIADEGLTNYSVKEIAKTLGAMMASEGFQEASEDAADWIMDYIVAWDKNEFSADIQKYIDQGYSKEEATKKVIADRGVEMLTDAIIGGIGGGVMGGAGTALAYSTGKYQTSPSVQTDLVMQSDEALAQLIQAVQTLDPKTAEDSERVEHAIEVSQKDADNLTVEDVVDMANVLNEQANGENNLAQTIQEINYQANYENNINEYRETGRISEKENELPIEKAAREQAQLAVEGYNKAVEAQQKQAQKDFINDLKSYKKNDWQSNEDTKAKTLQSLNEASNYFENETAAKNFVDNYKGQNLRMYAEVSYLAYTAGETGQSFDTFLKNSVEADLMIKHGGVDKGYLKTLFYNGQNARRTAENTVALKKNENRGLATNLTPDDQLAVFKKAIAKKLGIEVNTNFDNAESRGNFVASLAKLVTNSTSDNEYQTIIHEMFEFARTYNAKGMELVDKTLTDMIVKKKGERSFVDAVNKYKDAYRRAGQSAPEGSDLRSEANKSASEAQDEFINDAISYIFSTDEGIEQLVDYIMSDENTTAKEKMSTIQAIKDWVDHLIQTIKNFLSGHKTEQYGYKYAEDLKLKSEELKAISLKLVSVLEDARKNLEAMTETEGKTEEKAEKVAHSLSVVDLANMNAQDESEYLAVWDVINKIQNHKYDPHLNIPILSYTPDLFLKVGLEDKPIFMTQKHYRDAIHPETNNKKDHFHGLSNEEIAEVPYILNHPAIIADSLSRNDSVIAIGNSLDYKGRPMLVALRTDGESTGYTIEESNFLTSVYGREGFEDFINNLIDKDKILYLDDKNSHALYEKTGLQLPLGLDVLGYNKIIQQSKNIVNSASNSKAKPLGYSEKTINAKVSEIDEDVKKSTIRKAFSLDVPYEETKNLVAIHNLYDEKLKGVLELGGFPMPSIAITKADMDHSKFGDISVVFRKDTIDPKKNKANKVYSGDAYTPTFPSVGYKVNKDAVWDVDERLNNIIGDMKDIFKYYGIDPDTVTDYLDRNNGSFVDAFSRKEWLKYAFVKDKGIEFNVPTTESTLNYKYDNDAIKYLALMFTADEAKKALQDSTGTYKEFSEDGRLQKIIDKINAIKKKKYGNLKLYEKLKTTELSFSEFDGLLYSIAKYYREGITQEIDRKAFNESINSIIDENKSEYEKWINDLFNGVIDKKGIRNNKEYMTSAGNRRSWDSLYDDYTLENIVKAMKGEPEVGQSLGGYTLLGSINRKFDSIADIHSEENRLKMMDDDEYSALRGQIQDDLYNVAKGLKPNPSWDVLSICQDIAEAAAKKKTRNGIKSFLSEWYKVSDEDMDEIMRIIDEAKNLPTGYFEAKPQRAVHLDEVAAVIVPSDDTDTIELLNEKGLPVVEYERGDKQSRIDAVNSVEDVRFSIAVTQDSTGKKLSEGQQEYFKNTKVLDEDGDLLKVYHGTLRTFYTFDRSFANGEGDMGRGFYFTNDENDVESNYANEHGADFTNKIEREAESLEGTEDYEDKTYDEIVEELREKYTEEPITLDCYLNIKNPCYVGTYNGHPQTYLLDPEEMDLPIQDDYDDEDEYYEAMDEAVAEIIEDLVDPEFADVVNPILFEAAMEGGITLENLKYELSEKYLEDDEGNLIGNEIARQIVEGLGYDGIIDSTVSQKFRGMGLTSDSVHFIVFDSNQAKLTDNENPTSNEDIRYSIKVGDDRIFRTSWGTEVVQNPTSKEYQQMREDVLEERPWLRGSGEPLFRHTFDEEGNEYYWEVLGGLHSQIEPEINKRFNTRTSQQYQWWTRDDKDDYPVDYSKRYSIAVTEDSTGRKLSEGQQTYFGKSVIRDKDGRLKVMYHGTPGAGFTIFENSDDGISYFFTDKKSVAASYSGVDYVQNPDTPMSLDEINEEMWNICGTSDEDHFFKAVNGKVEYWDRNTGELAKEKTFDTLRDAQNYFVDEYIFPMVYQGTRSPSNYEVYLNAENPFVYEAKGKEWNDLEPEEYERHFSNLEIIPVGDKFEVDYQENGPYFHKIYTEEELDNIFGDGTGTMARLRYDADGQYFEANVYLDKNNKRIFSNTRELARYAKENGYDSLIINDVVDSGGYNLSSTESSQVVVVFNSNQIKSIYNLNPTKNEDIRYSIDVPFFESFEEIDNKVNLDEKDLQKLVEGISDLDSKVSQKAVDDIAGQIKKQYNSKIDKKRLANDIMSVFRYLKATGKMSMDDVMFVMSEIARPVLEQVEEVDPLQEKLYKDFVDTVKKYKISLDAGQKQEVVNSFGSYFNFITAMRGKLQISNEGTPLDNVWTEICDKSGGALSYGTNPNDQPTALAKYITSLNPTAQELKGQDLDSASTDLALEIFRQFYVYQSMADAAQKVKGEITKRANEAKERYKKQYNEAIKEVEREKALNAQRLAEEIDNLTSDEQEAIRRGDTVNQALIENLKADYKRRLERLQAQQNDKIARVKAQYQNSWINKNIRRQTSELKHRLLREVKALQNMIAHPAEGASKHVPVSLINPTIEMLEAINLDNGGRNKAIADRLKKMAEVYESFKNDPNYAFDYDERIASDIEELQEMFARRSYADLSVAELQRVLEIVGALKTQIKNANNLILQDKLADARAAATEAMDQVKGSRRHDNAAMNALNAYGNLHLNAYREFRKLSGYRDGALMDIYNDLDEGSRREMQIQKDLGQIFQDVLEGQKNQKEVKKFISTKDEDLVDIGITDKNGKPIKITRAMRMSLIMHSMNSGNMRHVLGSGITIPNMYYFAKGKLDEAYAKGTNYRFVDYAELLDAIQRNDQNKVAELTTKAQERVEALKKDLSAWEKKFLKDAEKMFHDETGKLINETSMKLKGYAIARVKNYFPIRTDRHFTKQEWAGLVQDASLEGMGMLKERVISSKPILLEDITNVIQRQIRNVSKYAGLAVPVRNFEAVMKQTSRDQNDGQLHNLYETIDSVWGSNDTEWLQNLMKDIQGGRHEAKSWLSSLRGKFAGATLALNPGVAISQAASYPTAGAVLGWKPLAKAVKDFGKGFVTQKGVEELEKINPLLWYRSQGYATQDLADAKNAKLPAGVQKFTKWIEFMDTGTVRTLEYASKYYVDDHYKNLKEGTEEYWQKVSEVFSKVVEETQPNYSTLHRADALRNPNSLLKIVNMFKTQAFQNFNIIYDAAGEMNAALHSDDKQWKKEATNHFANAVSSQGAALAMFSAIKVLQPLLFHRIAKFRDDDDKWSWEKLLSMFGWQIGSTISGSFFIGSEIFDLVKALVTKETYYGVDFSTMSMLTDFADTIYKATINADKLEKADTEAEKDKATRGLVQEVYNMANVLGQFAGVPVNNIKNLISSVFFYATDIIESIENGELEFSNDSDLIKFYTKADVPNQYERIYDAFSNMDSEKYNRLVQELVDKEIKNGLTEEEASEKVQSDVIDKIAKLMKEDYLEGNISEEELSDFLVEEKGKTEDEAYYQIREWETGESKYGVLKDSINTAAEDLTPENRKAVIDEIEDLLAHGTDKSTISSNITTNYKAQYIDLYNQGKAADLNAILRAALVAAGYSDEDAKKKLENWVK